MSTSEKIIILILFLWLVFTLLYTLFNRQLGIYTRRWDIFRWLSSYQLFSKTSSDYHLLYRDKQSDNSVTVWRTISLTPAWKFFHIIWFPQKLVPYTVLSVIDDMTNLLEKKKDTIKSEKIKERFLYQVILHFVSRFPWETNTIARQFKIERITENLIGQEIFISDFHPR